MKKLYAVLLLTLSISIDAAPKEEIIISDLKWVDSGHLERQRALVDEISRLNFGARIRKDKGDLKSLQRIIDEELVNQTEKQKLQALGVVLGDIYVHELGLEWKVYLDSQGKSRATCLKGTEYCLFPVTMISKRAQLGVKPNVTELYEKGVRDIEAYLPKLPYSSPKK
jgi:Domain of unknown function (DUF3806)